MKVKCINAKTEFPDEPPLVEGQIYEVKGENYTKNDWVLVGQTMSWLKTRFVVVDDSPIQESECPCGIMRKQCDYHRA